MFANNWTLFLYGMPPNEMYKWQDTYVKINKDFCRCVQYALLYNIDHEYVTYIMEIKSRKRGH